MPTDESLWAAWVMNRYSPNEIELKALKRSFIEAYTFYVYKPTDITSDSVYYMTLKAFAKLMNTCKISYYSVTEWRGDHVFFDIIEWSRTSCSDFSERKKKSH